MAGEWAAHPVRTHARPAYPPWVAELFCGLGTWLHVAATEVGKGQRVNLWTRGLQRHPAADWDFRQPAENVQHLAWVPSDETGTLSRMCLLCDQ